MLLPMNADMPFSMRLVMHRLNSEVRSFRWQILEVHFPGRLFLIGLFSGIRPLVTAGIVLFSLAVLFQLVTLPVEINASSQSIKNAAEYRNPRDRRDKRGKKGTDRSCNDLCGSAGRFHTAASETFDTCRRTKKG